MEDDVNEPATKGDLRNLELRIDTKLETVKDEIIRAFGMTEEKIRKDSAHVDEVTDLDNRVTRVEKHLGLRE